MATPKLNSDQVENVEYDNTISGLTATDMKAALDELQASKMSDTGATGTSGFVYTTAAKANSMYIPNDSDVVTIYAGPSGGDRSELEMSADTIEVKFDGGASEYIFRQGGPTTADDVIDKGYVDTKFVESDETVITNGVKINNIVAAPTFDIEALGTPDPNTIYVPNDVKAYEYVQIPCSSLTIAATTGTNKGFDASPITGTITNAYIDLLDGGTATGITADIDVEGTSILHATDKLKTDVGEDSSRDYSGTAVNIITPAINAGDRIIVSFDVVPTDALGIVVTIEIEKT